MDSEDIECEWIHDPPIQLKSLCNGVIDEENYMRFRQTPQTVKRSVSLWGTSLQYVRSELITFELCKLAVESNEMAIEFVPRDKLTNEEYYQLCLHVVSKNGFLLQKIPTDVITREIVESAHAYTCCAIMYTPREFLTEELCWKAIQRNGDMIKYIPADLATDEMRKAAEEYNATQKKAQKERVEAMTDQLIREGELNCPIQ